MPIRNALPSDFAGILHLNAESVHFLSLLTLEKLEQLHEQAVYHRVVETDGQVVAFLLAFHEASLYDSLNYVWFCDHYDHFLYVDRIVVSPACRGQKLGNRLYEDLISFARENNFPRITCEVDIEPLNEVSQRFHARFGFQEVGTQQVACADKRVSMQMLSLSTQA